MNHATCIIDGCDKPSRNKRPGLCGMHYMRKRTTGQLGGAGTTRVRQTGACSVDECETPAACKGLCRKNYVRLNRHGSTGRINTPQSERDCSVDGCVKPAHTRELCMMHYARLLNHGTTDDRPRDRPSQRRDANGNKHCRRCDTWLAEDQFARSSNSGDGLHTYCSWCMNLSKYGLTRITYREMLDAQGGTCALCQGPQWGSASRFAVDHDHDCCPGTNTCGKCVRGLLCNACNSALGMMQDDPARLRAAADYIERFRQ